ncbi:MAG: hypothetical protein MHM6MM_002243 [Cercozoa sp. M6MM]
MHFSPLLVVVIFCDNVAAYAQEKYNFECLLVRPAHEPLCRDLSSEYLYLDESIKQVEQLKCAKATEYGCFRVSERYGVEQREDEKYCSAKGCRDVAHACDPSECYVLPPPEPKHGLIERTHKPTQQPYEPTSESLASYRYTCHTVEVADYARCTDLLHLKQWLILSMGTSYDDLKCATASKAVCWDIYMDKEADPSKCPPCKDVAFACPRDFCGDADVEPEVPEPEVPEPEVPEPNDTESEPTSELEDHVADHDHVTQPIHAQDESTTATPSSVAAVEPVPAAIMLLLTSLLLLLG